jgi:formate/nitrite transporter FocA (FNT family)
MGKSLVAEGLLRARLPDAAWRPVVVKLGYSLGFLMVIIGRQQLFTENTLTPILPLMARRDAETFWRVLRLQTVVFASNIADAHIGASALAVTPAFKPEAQRAFAEIPTLLGNGIGGVSLVAAVNHAQVVAGSAESRE